MKTKWSTIHFLILAGLISAALGAYYFGITFITPNLPTNSGLPPLSQLNLPSKTQNGFTVSLKSYYTDAMRIVFRVRLKGGKGFIDNPRLMDENGADVNASVENGPQTGNDPSVDQIEFDPAIPLGDHFKGKLDFVVVTVFAGSGETLAHFSFDLDLPVHPALTFEPKQTISPLILEVLLDRVVITPAYTQVYLCYQKPDNLDWMPGYDTTLKLGDQQAKRQAYNLLFDSTMMGGGDKGGELHWIPPVQDGRCVKLGFPIGDAHPHLGYADRKNDNRFWRRDE